MAERMWRVCRNGRQLVDGTGRIIGRVSERAYPHWDEWEAEAGGQHIGIYASEAQAKAAVERRSEEAS